MPANVAEGSARETKRDYLHFLCISRGSLSETQYFIHLAHRLGYPSGSEAMSFQDDIKRAFGCLHGLIRAVEKESGKFARVAAVFTSLLATSLARLVGGPVVL